MACNKCGDTGWITSISVEICPCCNGKGKMPNKDKCARCNASKVVTVVSREACQYHDIYKDHA